MGAPSLKSGVGGQEQLAGGNGDEVMTSRPPNRQEQDAAVVEITGVRRSPAGETSLVELEAPGAQGALRLAQSGRDTSLYGALLGDRLLALVDGVRREALIVPVSAAEPLPAVPPIERFAEEPVEAALRPLIARLGGGLYSVEQRDLPAALVPGAAPVLEPSLIDPGLLAPSDGAPIALELGAGFSVLLGGRDALGDGGRGLVISGAFLLGGEGVEMRRHDLGAREGYARSPRHLFEERLIRNAVCDHQAANPDADLGRFAPDVLEPAAALARALLFDLSLLPGAPALERPERVVEGDEVAFVARAAATGSGSATQLVLVSRDGFTLSEARASCGERWETGLRPSARALLKAVARVRETPGNTGERS